MKRAFCLIVSLLACAAPAWGHSSLLGTEPQDGAVLEHAPNEIRIWFSEPIKVALSTFQVRDATGKEVDRRNLRADKKEPTLVRLSLASGLGPGTYKVSWTAVAQDMHVGKGSFSFRVGP
jgi:methionine-rich copper-binding protein CopC